MSTCSPLTPAQFDELSSWESSLTAHGKTPSRHTCCSCPPRAARHVLWITSSGSGHVLNKYGLKTKIRKQKPPSYVILAAPPAPSIHQQSARRHGSCLNNMSADWRGGWWRMDEADKTCRWSSVPESAGEADTRSEDGETLHDGVWFTGGGGPSSQQTSRQLEDEAAAEEEEGGCFLLCQQGRTEATWGNDEPQLKTAVQKTVYANYIKNWIDYKFKKYMNLTEVQTGSK